MFLFGAKIVNHLRAKLTILITLYLYLGGEPDWDNEDESCVSWRRFANLWETSQSLFWASFGLVDLAEFDLTGMEKL